MQFGLSIFIDTKTDSREHCGDCLYLDCGLNVCRLLFDNTGSPHSLDVDKTGNQLRPMICRYRSEE